LARHTGPVDRLSRREGRDLRLKGERYFKGKSPMQRRPFPPGQHTQSRRKLSTYGQQLREKQSLKRIYGVLERQFRRTFQQASRLRGVTGTALLQILESRLDNVVYRAGLASTRAQGRQLVSHGHVRVDGHKVDIPSYQVKPGQKIGLSEKARANKEVAASLELIEKRGGRKHWIEYDPDTMTATLTGLPERADLDDVEVNEQMIVELYSR
jgi:small subunit ribosomal protein S4